MRTLAPQDVTIALPGGALHAIFQKPAGSNALVVFAHGSGSSRKSARNQFVAEVLADAGFGYLLLDLLTEEEDRVYANRFDIALLAERLAQAVCWAREGQVTQETPIALFGASTGAAAALIAAADSPAEVCAVVSRGGRPDLAGDALARVHCPCRFIVGEMDYEVLDLNRHAMSQIPPETVTDLKIVPGATHLFEEPGTLDQAAKLARDWFLQHTTTQTVKRE